ncbi:MAG: adenosylmethionine--8-amino-7-oxononanoate transaminase [Oceanococcus sp.]
MPSLAERDLAHIWHPCSQMKDHETLPMIEVDRGEGMWLYDTQGKRYLDVISSWWVNIFGHSHPHIVEAISAQAQKLEHVIFAGHTHEPAVRLAERLIDLAPPGFDKIFFADNGSAAVEVALKMSFHYWRNKGQQRTRFVHLSNAYHGETLGALSVGDVALYKETYQPLLLDAICAPGPDNYEREEGESPQQLAQRKLQDMRDIFQRHAGEVCAVIVEPLVQCAGSMRMYDPSYLTGLRALCDEFDVHLIADEIAVGFGRTGTMFACEQANIRPDFMCLSKGLTGGWLPMAVVLTDNEVYDAFYDEYHTLKAFLHSHSYTGNPLACAVANATLDLFERTDVMAENRVLAQHMAQSVAALQDHPHVADIRQSGMILAIEMVRNRKTREAYDWKERRGLKVYQHGMSQGALLRPLGNVVYWMPPYVITPEQIDWLAKITREGIDFATAE